VKIVAYINMDERVGVYLKDIESRFQVKRFENLPMYSPPTESSVLIANFTHFNAEELNALNAVKRTYPSLAILVTSDRYIEILSFWCLRNNILDYLILPDEIERLKETLLSLSIVTSPSTQEKRKPLAISTTVLNANSFNLSDITYLKTKKAIEYVNLHYYKKIRVETLAAKCNYSVTSFSAIFKKENGVSAMEYVNSRRVMVAKSLLAETTLSVSSIAYQCGFEDVSYFVKVFKNMEQTTPSKYRRKYQVNELCVQ